MGGRVPYNPGPGNITTGSKSLSEWQIKSRTYDGEIIEVDTVRGIAKVRIEPLARTLDVQVASVSGLSVPQTDTTYIGAQGAWRRFMPHPGTQVTVAFNADGACRLMSFHESRDVAGPEDPSSRGDQHLGYAFFQRAALRGELGLRPMVELRSGEWHDRSSGGAEVYGRDNGTLELVGGIARIALRRRDESIIGEAERFQLGDRVATRVEWGLVQGRAQHRVWVGPKNAVNATAMAPRPPGPSADVDVIPPQLAVRSEMGDLDGGTRIYVRATDPTFLRETYVKTVQADGAWTERTDAVIVSVDSTGYEVEASQVRLGRGARQPVLRGDDFLRLLTTAFQCVTPLGPSGPMTESARQALEAALSQVVEVA